MQTAARVWVKSSREVGVESQDVWVVPGRDVALEDLGGQRGVQAQGLGGGEVADVVVHGNGTNGDRELHDGAPTGIVEGRRQRVVTHGVVHRAVQELGLACKQWRGVKGLSQRQAVQRLLQWDRGCGSPTPVPSV